MMSPTSDDPFPNKNLGNTNPTNASIRAVRPGTSSNRK